MIIFVDLKMQVGHMQIILPDHVSLKVRNTYIKLDFSVTRPSNSWTTPHRYRRGIVIIEIYLSLTQSIEIIQMRDLFSDSN